MYVRFSFKLFLLSLAALFFHAALFAQEQDFKRRFSFAKSYFGMDFDYLPSYGTGQTLDADGGVQPFDYQSRLVPRINLGGTHFWGHADFYVSIRLRNFELGESEVENELNQRVFTGLRIYPSKIQANRLRPFLGYKFSAHQYRQFNQADERSQFTQVKSVVDIGLAYQTASLYAYVGYNRIMNPNFDFYATRSQTVSTQFPNGFFNIGVNWQIETTRTEQTAAWLALKERLGKSNKHGLFFGIGPSSAFPLTNSPRISQQLPFLDQKAMPSVFLDLAVGYHLSKWGTIVNLAYRPITQERHALSFEQTVKRRSWVLEAVKELGDYHGFVPFLGIGIGYENIGLTEMDRETVVTDNTYRQATPILTFGWDIRPNKSADWFILRTNLRYAPFLNVESGAAELRLNQLEFNFIQAVFYPWRRAQYRVQRK
ncbi:MAG: hypothetical protein AAF960_18155 [Bacteroidota bacterium]